MGRVHRPLEFLFYAKGLVYRVLQIDFDKRQVLVGGVHVRVIVEDDPEDWRENIRSLSFDEGEILQYTNNIDQNGHKLYDHDIVSYLVAGTLRTAKIWWSGDHWQVGDNESAHLSALMCLRLGNYYTHPELKERIRDYVRK